MQPITLEQLKTGLVRCAERWPDRVAEAALIVGHDVLGRCDGPGSHCLVGEVLHDAGQCMGAVPYGFAIPVMNDASTLMGRAMKLNDAGLPWRQIVIELGLITPEAVIEAACGAEASEPSVAVEAVPEEVLA